MRMQPWCFLLLLLLTEAARANDERFYLGTYTSQTGGSQGIYVDTLNPDNGQLGHLQLAAPVKEDPTFLARSSDGRFLFAALSDAVAAFAIQGNGTLLPINRHSSGPNTCHVSLDRTGRELFAASYDTGSVSAYPISAAGKIGPRISMISLSGSGPNLGRQAGPHAHSVYVDPQNRFLYACDLGSDRIWIFRLRRNGELICAHPPSATVAPGSGPRHLAFSPGGHRVYVVNELGVSTSVFSRNPHTGALTLLETEDNIDPGWPQGTGSAEIALHPSGKWLCVSTRFQDRMTVFRLNGKHDPGPAGAAPGTAKAGSPAFLHRQEIVPSPVKFPRSFAIDPTGRWLVVAGQTDDSIAVMKIDAESGELTPTDQRAKVSSPVCVLFAPQSNR